MPLTTLAQRKIDYTLDIYKSRLLWKGTKTFGGGHNGFVFFKSGTLTAGAKGKLLNGLFIVDMATIKSTDNSFFMEKKDVDGVLKAGNFFSTGHFLPL